ncbi:MAG: hypothetical protein ABIQ52_20850 [Vicinamibacterales bacterium]
MSHRYSAEAYDDERLIRYLVGSLPEDESERFDELSISDDEFASRLRGVEDDLVDAYVRGDLAADIRDRFESLYLTSRSRHEKVRFAKALSEHGSRASFVGGGDAGPRPRAGRRDMRQWAMAAAATLVLAAAGYLFVERMRNPLPQPAAPSRTAAATAAVPEPVPPTVTLAKPVRPDAPVLSFVLMPPTRGISEPPGLVVPAGTAKVELRAVLESDDLPRYRIALKDPGTDQIIWRSARLNPATSLGNRVVSVTLDATLLKSQRYVLDVTGFSAAGRAELVGSYPFRVVVQ